MDTPPVMQRENERGRTAIEGRRTDDGTPCTLLVVREVGGTWAIYPHGADKFGVRLSDANAAAAAHAIIGSAKA